jgi:hypothetical protein
MQAAPAQLRDFAARYAAAWCSQDPTSVAGFYSPGGSLTVNNDVPAVGRNAIAEVAQSFMTAFPDRTPAAPRDIPSNWVFLLPGTGQTSLRRLRPVPPEFDALFAAARTWDTLTSVSLPLP